MTTHANAGETLAEIADKLKKYAALGSLNPHAVDLIGETVFANISAILAALRAQSAQPAEITDDRIYAALKCVRGCATDDQFQELRSNVERLLLAAQPAQADATRRETIEECARKAERWLEAFADKEPQFVSAQKWAVDAVKDIVDAIRALANTPSDKGEG